MQVIRQDTRGERNPTDNKVKFKKDKLEKKAMRNKGEETEVKNTKQ